MDFGFVLLVMLLKVVLAGGVPESISTTAFMPMLLSIFSFIMPRQIARHNG